LHYSSINLKFCSNPKTCMRMVLYANYPRSCIVIKKYTSSDWYISKYISSDSYISKPDYSKLKINHKKPYIFEYISVDNILCSFAGWVDVFVWSRWELYSFARNTSWQCNVQMSVREHRFRKIYSNMWDSLSMSFVNSHGKTESNWELLPFALERKRNVLRRA
jgi:hypothetical protein